MKKLSARFWISICGAMCLLVCCTSPALPPPTKGTIVMKDMEDGTSANKRDAWLESMHRGAPGVNWRGIELQNALNRQERSKNRDPNRHGEVTIAEGKLSGTWSERGSDNQAGSVMASAYDGETGYIYTIAAGGSLFRGTRFNDRWEVVNEEFVFDGHILEIFRSGQQKTLLASSAGIPMFSLDMGRTWEVSKGIAAEDPNAISFNCVLIGNDDPEIYLLTKSSYWNPIGVYRSLNGGKSFSPIKSLGNSETGKFWLTSPPGTGDLYLFDRIDSTRTDLYQFAHDVHVFWPIETTTRLTFHDSPVMVVSRLIDSMTYFFAYATGDTVKVSADTGKTWSARGVIPEHPWSRRFFVFESDPAHMLAGGVELFSSHDGGFTWEKVNAWWEYYDDVPNKIHADMMYFREFFDPDQEVHFTLISNHGGMSMTTDFGKTTQNIGMVGLNVSQYYSVRTDPINPLVVYAGSQDQGFQRSMLDDDSRPADFDQLISGDYGHIVFSEFGHRLWTVYPNGSVSYYHQPQTDPGPRSWYELESENESVWIPPLSSGPYAERNEIYMAGGNIDGGTGSHLIRLSHTAGGIEAAQFPYDFRTGSKGEVSSIAFSPLAAEVIYVGTTRGGFFTSMDGGQTWIQNEVDGPGAQYLYGNDILASRLTQGLVLFAGSGYSNPPVWVSYDHGDSFQPMSDGLPPTLVFEIAANAEETLYFAATESGPYVYIVDDEAWYPMSEGAAPSTRYWSVEFLEGQERVRFGTYGRGIWDFRLMETTSSDRISDKKVRIQVFPNPASNNIRISDAGDEPEQTCNVSIFGMDGVLVLSLPNYLMNQPINLAGLAAGPYIVQCQFDELIQTRKIFKQ